MSIGRRQDFGKDWDEVVSKWCLGQSLPISGDNAWEALGVLESFWPEYLGKVLTRGQRGSFIMAHVIDDGLTIATSLNLQGFEGVLNRMKVGEQAAFSEMRFGATLVDLGYQPMLDEEHKGKRPDALIQCEDQEVFIDVILPQRSDPMKHLSAIGGTLAHNFLDKISATFTNKRLEIFVLCPDLLSIREEIDRFLNESKSFITDKIYEIPGIALIRFNDGSTQIDTEKLIPVNPDPLIMGFASISGQTGNSVILRCSSADERLQRMLNDKSHQFSKEEANLFVIDLSLIPHGFKNWPALVRRRLQIDRNRRFSGVLLLYRELDISTGSFVLHSHLEQHPNPYKRLTASLIDTLTKLSKE